MPHTIVFFGTPQVSADVLTGLLSTPEIEIAAVVSTPDKPIGRHQILTPSAVKRVALENNIPTYTPEKLRDNSEFEAVLRSIGADYFVVIAYGKLLPDWLLQLPKKLALNIHGSILPKYRGASPVQSALLHGEEEIGITIMEMVSEMDAGAVLLTEKWKVTSDMTTGSTFEHIGNIGARVMYRAIDGFESGILQLTEQNHTLSTKCAKIEKESGKLDFTKSSHELYHQWQAYTPWPGVFTYFEGKQLKVTPKYSTQEYTGSTQIGQVIRLGDNIGIISRSGVLWLESVQIEGKKAISALDFVNGYPHVIGCILGKKE